MAVPRFGVEQQIRVGGQQRQGFAQLCKRLSQSQLIDRRVAAQGKGHVSMTTFVDQLEAQTGLLHLTGLTHLALVETDKFRRLGVVAQSELLRGLDRSA